VQQLGAAVSRMIFADEQLYRKELDRIFGLCWLFLGHDCQLGRRGAFFNRHMGEEPVLVTKPRWQAPCVTADEEDASSFTRPYYAWTFKNDGRLIVATEIRLYSKKLDFAANGAEPATRRIPGVESQSRVLQL